MTTVSVVIPALNEGSNIRQAVLSAWQADADEVIVADGGSNDRTAEIAEVAGAKLVIGPAGRARQQNAGAACATSDILLFQHADCWIGRDAIRQIRNLQNKCLGACGGFQQVIEGNTPGYRLVAYGNGLRVRWLGMAYGDQGIFLPRSTFDRLNGFADVPLMEDVLLCQILRKIARLRLLPGPIHVSNRRWKRFGLIRQTLRNWSLITAFRCGVPPDRLARFYPSHDRE